MMFEWMGTIVSFTYIMGMIEGNRVVKLGNGGISDGENGFGA